MRKFFIIFFIISCRVWSFSQNNTSEYAANDRIEIVPSFSKNTVGLDIGYFNFINYIVGTSTILNYERSLIRNLNLRFGFGYFSIPINKGFSGLQFPVSLNFLSGKKNNHFEMDLGGRLTFFESALNAYSFPNEYMVSILLNVGYRYQKPSNGFIFRALVGFDGLTLGAGYAF